MPRRSMWTWTGSFSILSEESSSTSAQGANVPGVCRGFSILSEESSSTSPEKRAKPGTRRVSVFSLKNRLPLLGEMFLVLLDFGCFSILSEESSSTSIRIESSANGTDCFSILSEESSSTSTLAELRKAYSEQFQYSL